MTIYRIEQGQHLSVLRHVATHRKYRSPFYKSCPLQVWMTPIKGLYTYIMLISLSVIIMTNDTGGVCDDDEKEEREVKGPPNEVLPLSFKRFAKHCKALQSIAKHIKLYSLLFLSASIYCRVEESIQSIVKNH